MEELFTNEELKLIEKLLETYKTLKIAIEQKDREIDLIKKECSTVGAIRYDKDRLSKSYNITSSVEDEVIRKEQKIEELELKKEKFLFEKNRIDSAKNNLTSNHRIIFDYLYDSDKKFSYTEISRQMMIHEDTLREWRREMLLSIANSLYPTRTLDWLENQFVALGMNDKNSVKIR